MWITEVSSTLAPEKKQSARRHRKNLVTSLTEEDVHVLKEAANLKVRPKRRKSRTASSARELIITGTKPLVHARSREEVAAEA